MYVTQLVVITLLSVQTSEGVLALNEQSYDQCECQVRFDAALFLSVFYDKTLCDRIRQVVSRA